MTGGARRPAGGAWRPTGLQSEILAHLAVVMVAATGLLAAFFFHTHAVQVERLSGLVGRALVSDVESPVLGLQTAGTVDWWLVEPDSREGQQSSGGLPLGEAELALAREAERAARPLVQSGRPWEPIRFASPLERRRGVAVAAVPAVVSRRSVATLVLADCLVFTLLGLYLLRHRVVLPLRRLSEAARRVGEGDLHVRVPVEGESEAAQLGVAFNDMTEQLEARSDALEKAVIELRDTNEQLRTARDGLDRAERLAAVGSLAAGVAHEVGNPMGALLAFQSMALKDPSLSDEVRAYLVKATTQGERVREILRQLLDFSRPPRAQRHAVDLRRIALQSVGLVQAQRRYEDVDFAVEPAPEVAHALGDESILAQILLNLILNAADAARASEHPRVRVRFELQPLSLRSGESRREAARQRSQYDGVACVVEDNGPGVNESERERIFDPFFSTKPPGEGTGLGLANAQRFAQELGGAIEVDASPSQGGAAFSLVLPSAGRDGGARGARESG